VYTTLPYVSPEAARFQLTSRGSYGKEGDIYAVIVMLYEVLLGSYPTEFLSYDHSNTNMRKILETKVDFENVSKW
jgi:serine/threonine protein kinase